MSPRTAIYKLNLRLNKLASSDYDNIPLHIAVEAINKAALDWTRRQIHGSNLSKEGDEETRMRVNDLQFLLKPATIDGKNTGIFFESVEFPEDFLYFKRILVNATKGECGPITLDADLVEEANVPEYLNDDNSKPSFEWEQCFYTLVGNKVRVYTNKDFKVKNVNLVYYRKPDRMDIRGYTNEFGGDSRDRDLEFKDDIAELIINEAAAIIAGDIESINQMQINSQRVENNN